MADQDEQRALVSLSLARLPNGQRIARRLRRVHDYVTFDVDTALAVLARRRSQPDACLRPMVIKRLLDLVRVDHDLLQHDGLAQLHQALAEEAGVPGHQLDDAARRLERALIMYAEVAGPPDPGPDLAPPPPSGDDPVPRSRVEPPPPPPPPPAPDPDDPTPVETYTATVAEVLAEAPPETVGPVACEDEQAVPGHAGAYQIAVSFRTDATVEQLLPWLDPSNWPGCDHRTFFRDMRTCRKRTPTKEGWEHVLLETVDLAGQAMKTCLRFEYTGGDAPSLHYTRSPYESHGDGKLLVDAGALILCDDWSCGTKQTLVTLTKAIQFASEAFEDWPTSACDLQFGEQVHAMASNCMHGYPT